LAIDRPTPAATAAVPGAFAVGERIVVGVNEHPGADRVIRAAQQLAKRLDAPWTAVTVETPRTDRLSDAARARLAASLNLAAELGGTIATIPAARVDHGLQAHARQVGATMLVLGKSRRSWWFELRHGSVVDALVRGLPGLAVHVLPLADAPLAEALRPAPSSWRGYGIAVVLVVMTTLVNLVLARFIGSNPLDMIYLVPVVTSATVLGLRPALLAAASAALAYDFVFLAPRYALTIQNPQDAVDFLVLGGVGVVVAQLAGRLRRAANLGARTAADNAAVAAFGQRLRAVADPAGAAQATCEEVASLLGAATVMLAPADGGLAAMAAVPAHPALRPVDLAAAEWALARGEPSGCGTATFAAAAWEFTPLRSPSGVLAVLGLELTLAGAPLPPDRRVLFTTLAGQAALTLERLELEAEARRADVLELRDNLRATLIAALGHDLRTPLTGVVAAAEELAREHADSPGAENLRASAWRLNRLFHDLVEMARIESGSLTVRREAVDLVDAVAGAARDLRRTLAHHRLVVVMPPGLPLVEADQRMLHHVLINLLDNAAKYTPAGTTVTVAASLSGSGLSLTIRDEGSGLPAGEEARVFQRFHRVEGSDQKGGTGLGLAIVKDFAEAMGLAVSAGNRADGQGSSFVLAWPAALLRQDRAPEGLDVLG
jgi:two-component system sensor histidine kinase KdpD